MDSSVFFTIALVVAMVASVAVIWCARNIASYGFVVARESFRTLKERRGLRNQSLTRHSYKPSVQNSKENGNGKHPRKDIGNCCK